MASGADFLHLKIDKKKNAMFHSSHRILSLYHSHIAGCFIAFFFLRFAFCFFFLLLWIKSASEGF